MCEIEKILSNRIRRTIDDKELSPAAVLLPIYKKEGKYYILLTKRTENLSHHKGEISLPGGSYEKEDINLEDTALRESYEEIGIRPEDVKILGKLDDVETLTSSRLITPYVGIIPYPYDFRINEREIKELIEVPISALLNKKESNCWVYDGHVIWGATAWILKNFLSLLPLKK